MAEVISKEVERTETFPPARLDYHAIFTGFIIAMSLQLLLNVLGNALGLALVTPASAAPERAISTGPVLWSLGIPLVSFLIGGLVSGVMAGVDRTSAGIAHGVLVWGLGVLFLAALWSLGATALTMPARATAMRADAWWLAFFSSCLALAGAAFGGYLGTRPLYRSVYSREFVHHAA